MSFTDVRIYFRDQMEALGFEEHKDPFNIDNIGSTTIDRSFQMTTGLIEFTPANQTVDASYNMTLNVLYNGFTNVSGGLDDATTDIDVINGAILKISNRIGTVIKDVKPSSVEPQVLGPTNDTIIVMKYEYEVNLICNYA